MKFAEQITLLLQLYALLRSGDTGSAKVFAQKLRVSRSYLYKVIEYLDAHCLEIYWDTRENTFCYRNRHEIVVQTPVLLKNKPVF